MLTTDLIATVIISTVEQFIDKRLRAPVENLQQDASLSARFHVQIAEECFGYDNKDVYHDGWRNRACKFVSVIVTEDHRVFVAVTDEVDVKNVKLEDYVNRSNHDSCWSSDGLRDLTDVYFKVRDEALINVPKKQLKNVHHSSHIRFANSFINTSLFDFVKVKCENIVNDHYFKKLTSVEPVNVTLKF